MKRVNSVKVNGKVNGLKILLPIFAFFALLMLLIVCATPAFANKQAPPDKNVEDNNCNCHTTDRSSDVTVEIIGPGKLVAGNNATYTVNIYYTGDKEIYKNNTKYGFSAELDGRDLREAGLSKTGEDNKQKYLTHDDYFGGVSPNRTFQLEVWAADKPQTMKLNVVGFVANSDDKDTGDIWNRKTKVIEVVPKNTIYINVTVRNSGEVPAQNFTVSLYIDDKFITSETINEIPPKGKYNVTFEWDASEATPGEHKAKIEIDEGNTVPELREGSENTIYKTIYVKGYDTPDKRTEKVYMFLAILCGMIAGTVAIVQVKNRLS